MGVYQIQNVILFEYLPHLESKVAEFTKDLIARDFNLPNLAFLLTYLFLGLNFVVFLFIIKSKIQKETADVLKIFLDIPKAKIESLANQAIAFNSRCKVG